MKFLKYGLIATGALILLIGAVAAYVAATFNPNDYKPQIVQAVKEKTQRTLKLEGDIRLSLFPTLGAKLGKATLSERGSEREFAGVDELVVAVKLIPLFSRQVVVDAVEIRNLRANLVRARDGKTNFDDLAAGGGTPAAESPARGADVKIDIARVAIENAALTFTDHAAGSRYTVSNINLKTGRIASGVPTRVQVALAVRSDEPKLRLATDLKTRLTFDAGSQRLALEDLELAAKGEGGGIANLAVKLAGSASVDGARQTAQANLAGKFADSSIKAQVKVAGFSAPAFNFSADIDQLDVDRYLLPQAVGGPAPGTQKRPEKEQPFDLSGLRNLRANGTLKIGSLKANNVKASSVRLDVKANGGRVEVNPLTANLYQGTLSSVATINAAPATPTFAVKHNMNGVNIGPLLKDLADNDTLEGRGNVTVDVRSQGNTVSALKKALNGNAALKLADGAVKGIDIASSIRNAKARLGTLRGEQTQTADKSQKTDFSELTATFKIANGVARNNDLSMKSPLLRVGGEGDINIGEDSLNYLVKATIVGTTKGQGGREAEELKGLTVPVRVSGPLAAPSFKLDFGAMVTDTAKQKVEQAVTRELQRRLGGGAPKDGAAPEGTKPGGSARDVLKGLFER